MNAKEKLEPPPSKEVMFDYLQSIYNDVSAPGSFQGVNKLYKAVKDDGVYRITLSDIEDWLSTNKSYTMYRPVKKVNKRSKVLVSGIDDQFEADLASLDKEKYVTANEGYKFLLVVIDVFSRFLWVRALKDKSATSVIAAFEDIFKSSNRLPRRMRSDRGTEFTAIETKKYFKRKGIHQIFTSNELQANYAERVIKTLKTKIFRYLETVSTPRYIDVLQDIVKSYNNTWHNGIRSKPKEVNKSNEKRLWWQMYWPRETFEQETKRLNKRKQHFKFKIGDFVRISLTKYDFMREYSAKWTGEIFIIASRFLREGSIDLYTVTDYEGEKLEGTFYRNELQKIKQNPADFFLVDEFLGERNNGKEVKVSYKSWPTKFNRWIKRNSLVKKDIIAAK